MSFYRPTPNTVVLFFCRCYAENTVSFLKHSLWHFRFRTFWGFNYKCWVFRSTVVLLLQSKQVKRTPQDSINGIDYLKNESVSRSRNWCQIQRGISACVMSRYFTRTSLYLVRLKIFEWIKFLRRHLHQIQENGAGRNFITASRVNSRLITHARVQRSIWNRQLVTDSTFE